MMRLAVLLLSLAFVSLDAFTLSTAVVSKPWLGKENRPIQVFMSTTSPSETTKPSPTGDNDDDNDKDDDDKDELEYNAKGLLKRDRYFATNRFAVRKGREAKFEQRWATRKSRLATLEGFRYFHLMRRVKINEDGQTVSYDGGEDDASSAQGNYVSFTIWQAKRHFSAWRKGEAFKEAHGGTSIGAFLGTMLNSAFVLRGAPRPAFYDGLLLQSTKPSTVPPIVDGWRAVENIDEVTSTLPTECFVACNQFYVPQSNAAAFEKRWADRTSKLQENDGFIAFSLLRRDGQAKGHGTVAMTSDEPTYQSTTIWKDCASFEGWRQGQGFQKAHTPPGKNNSDKAPPASPPQPLWTKPPTPVFYEGTLVITSEEGA